MVKLYGTSRRFSVFLIREIVDYSMKEKLWRKELL